MVSVGDVTQRRKVRMKCGNKGNLRGGVLVSGLLLKDCGSRERVDFLDGLLDFGGAVTPGNQMLLQILCMI